MAILVGSDTRLLVQGITGREGGFHAEQMRKYGTNIVGGVTPGRGGQTAAGVPVFNTVAEAARETNADASIIFVPPAGGADAIMEAAAAGLELVVCTTEFIPVHDMVRVIRFLEDHPARLIGPNCPGLITPGAAKVGVVPEIAFSPGRVGVMSRSGTVMYEVCNELTRRGIGQSTAVGIGGDPIIGTTFEDALRLFMVDDGTDLVVLLGEIGGSDEEDAAAYLAALPAERRKPVVAFISGRSAPPGKRMGHAGAIISGGVGGPEHKVDAFRAAGVPVADNIPQVGEFVAQQLSVVSSQ
jgi:succinyl-CoA synthetase alpha subunit